MVLFTGPLPEPHFPKAKRRWRLYVQFKYSKYIQVDNDKILSIWPCIDGRFSTQDFIWFALGLRCTNRSFALICSEGQTVSAFGRSDTSTLLSNTLSLLSNIYT